MHHKSRFLIPLLSLFICAAARSADIKLPSVISSNMVLQRNVEVPLWGWADAGEKITVKLGDKNASATAGTDGKWLVKFPSMPAGGPHEITIEGAAGKSVTLKNVLFGEVWLCSGQSNMEMQVQSCENAKEDIAAANDPQIRMFTVGKAPNGAPQTDCPGKWEESSPATVGHFSGVAYFFAQDLKKALNVPVGLLHSSWGGTPAESWASRSGLEKIEAAKPLLERWDKTAADFDEAKAKAAYEARVKTWEEVSAKAKEEKKAAPKKPNYEDPRLNPWRVCNLYNGMIAPLIPYAIAGSIWYQGESNCGRAQQYRTLFPGMIQSWRTAWNQENMPFYFVQIAPYNYKAPNGLPYAELCEAQFMTLKMPNTGMAVIHDVGNVKDIHPKNKKAVGHRLALWALAKTYGQKDLVFSGPLYKEMKIEGDKIRIGFDHVGGGLAARDGKELTHFTIAGEDQKFLPATATIDAGNVVVHSATVAKPVAVRFAWHEAAEPNLMNKEGLPASLFRTDDFKMVTDGKNN